MIASHVKNQLSKNLSKLNLELTQSLEVGVPGLGKYLYLPHVGSERKSKLRLT